MQSSDRLMNRKQFLQQCVALTGFILPFNIDDVHEQYNMKEHFDVIIIGGSYAGLSAAMALGRALRKVLIIDAGKPANRFTPHSHNFITHDGRPPAEIAEMARAQVDKYPTIKRVNGRASQALKTSDGFHVVLDSAKEYSCRKLIFASGIIDIVPDMAGLADCWGKSVLHCPYCHGYEVRHKATAILANADVAFELASLVSNWTNDLVILSNGASALTDEQQVKLAEHHIRVIETPIDTIQHEQGYVKSVVLKNKEELKLSAIYMRPAFQQHCDLPARLGCELNQEGYIQTNAFQQTSVPGIYACGDNVTRIRTVANAVSMGTTAGMMLNKELILESF